MKHETIFIHHNPHFFLLSSFMKFILVYRRMHIIDYGNSIPISLSFIFLFLFQFENVFPAPARHVCRPEQRDALLQFKNEFEIGKPSYICGDSFVPKTKSWANNIDCCCWDGIKCDPKSGEVIVVDLSCSGLHGRFHSDSKLFRIHTLRFLDLSYNNFSGRILSSVGNFSQLAISASLITIS